MILQPAYGRKDKARQWCYQAKQQEISKEAKSERGLSSKKFKTWLLHPGAYDEPEGPERQPSTGAPASNS